MARLRSIACWCALTAVLGVSAGTHAQVYKWKDAEGRVHYSSSPPAGADATQVKDRIGSYSGPAQVSTVSGAAGGDKSVIIYTTKTCGYCIKAKQHLAARRIPFKERDVEESPAARTEFSRLGGRGVPVILVGAARMDGYDETRLAGLLKQAGW